MGVKKIKKLTLKHAIENKFTAIDLVKYFKPEWDNEQCDFYLWEFTCFPFSNTLTIEQLNNQLR